MIVQIIERKQGAALIQWDDEEGLHRGIIPEEVLGEDGVTVRDELLSLSIPYGVDWEVHLEGTVGLVTPAIIARNLRNAGIWTAEDALSNPKSLIGAVQKSYAGDLAAIINVAKMKYKNKEV